MVASRAVSHQAAPPRNDPAARRHGLQHYDSQEWKDLERNVCFIFEPRLLGGGIAEFSDIEWEAKLHVKARDLPRLLREGFHWDGANLDREAGYIRLDVGDDEDDGEDADEGDVDDRWSCSRTFFLSDLGADPQWTAKLVVYAESTSVLSRFAVTDLDMGTIKEATAWRATAEEDSTRWVYYWGRQYQEASFNAIYDDMPLTGWWPWPRLDVEDDDDITLVGGTANEI
ncbi:hypothetical protein LX36DRAFT_714687 [Colletotrichum falcatum]|nr:hypothetical protein LX36DRAFT_714687 [Colletotrichum falcatum]